MLNYLIKRLLLLFITLFGIALISFLVVTLAPGDPASLKAQGLGKGSTGINDFTIRKNKELFFLDRPRIINLSPNTRKVVVQIALEDLASTVELQRKDAQTRLVSAMGTAALDGLVSQLSRATAVAATERAKRAEALDALEQARGDARVKLLAELARDYVAFEPRLETPDDQPPSPDDVAAVWLRQRQAMLEGAEAPARRIVEVLSSTPSWRNQVPGIRPAERGGPPVTEDMPLEEADRSWQAWWQAHSAELTPAKADAAAKTWLATPLPPTDAPADAEPSEARQQLDAVGQLAAPVLMEALEDAGEGSEQEQRAAAGLALVCKKPWKLSPEPDEIRRYENEWKTQSEALEAKKPDMHPSAYERQKRKLGSQEDYVAAAQEKAFEKRRKQWAEWWYRSEEFYVDFSGGQQLERAFTQTQFGRWVSRFIQLDFGESYKEKRPVADLLIERLPVTLALNAASLSLVYLFAIPIGIYSAVRKDSPLDRASTLFLFFLYSVPSFWAGAMLLMLFTGEPFFDWFPAYGYQSLDADQLSLGGRVADWAWHLVLPVICLTYAQVAYVSKQMRAGMLDVIRQDYIRTARAKGVDEKRVIFKHALRNGLIPILTLMGSLLPYMFGGSVIIESIFTIEGLGKLAFQAILDRDYPVIMANLVISGFLTLLGILIVDIAYAVVDPRIEFR